MLDAGSTGIQQSDLTARTNGGSSSHQRQVSVESGCPQRGHCGEGSSGSRDQHTPHTTPLSSEPMSLSQETHTRGSNRSNAPAPSDRTRDFAPALTPATAASPPGPARGQTIA